jgi:hypothetical protein
MDNIYPELYKELIRKIENAASILSPETSSTATRGVVKSLFNILAKCNEIHSKLKLNLEEANRDRILAKEAKIRAKGPCPFI